MLTHGDYPVIKIGNITSYGVDLTNCQFTNFNPGTNFTVKTGDLLIALSGATTGKMTFAEINKTMFINQRVMLLRFYNQIDKYLYSSIISTKTKDILNKAYGGAQPNISSYQIDNMLVPLIPYNEQIRLSSFIKSFVTLVKQIEFEQYQILKLKDYLKQKIVELGINGKLLVGDDNSYYKKTTLNTCGKLISGRDLSLNLINKDKRGIPYLTGASQIEDGNIVLNRWTESPCVISELNDVLITVKGTIGKTAINNYGNIHIARQIMAFRTNEQYIPKYIELCFKESSKELNYKNNSLIPGVSRSYILNINLNAFPISYQTKLISKINQIDSILATM